MYSSNLTEHKKKGGLSNSRERYSRLGDAMRCGCLVGRFSYHPLTNRESSPVIRNLHNTPSNNIFITLLECRDGGTCS